MSKGTMSPPIVTLRPPRTGVMTTPALVVDGQVRLAGHIGTARQIRQLLEGAP